MKIKDKDKFIESFFSSESFSFDLNLFKGDISKTSMHALSDIADYKFSKTEALDSPDRAYRKSLSREKIRNSPWYIDPNSIYNDDPIPLTIYKKMSYDSTIVIAMNLITGLVSSLKWKVKADNEEVSSVCEFAISNVIKQLIRDMIVISFRNGWFFGEKVWDRKEVTLYDINEEGVKAPSFSGFVVYPKKVKGLDPQNHFRFYKDKVQDEITHIEQDQLNGTVSVKREKLFWFAIDKEFSNVFGRSRFRAAYKYWYDKNLSEGFYSNNLALGGNPPIIGYHPDGYTAIDDTFDSSVPNDTIMNEATKDLLDGAAVIFPSTRDEQGNLLWFFDFKDFQIADLGKYKDTLDYYMQMILLCLGIPMGVLDGDNNASELDAKTDLLFVIIEQLLDQLEDGIQKELLDYIVQYNFGPEAILTTKFEFDRNGLGRRSFLKEILINLLRISVRNNAQPRVLPDIVKISEDLGLPYSGYSEQFMKDPYAVEEVSNGALSQESNDKKNKRAIDQNGNARINRKPRENERPSKAQRVTSKRR